MKSSDMFPRAEQLDAQRANHLQSIHPSTGTLEADIVASPMLSRRHRAARTAARVVGAVGLTSAALGVVDAYNGATHDIPEARNAVVQEVDAIDMRDTDTAITTGLFTEEGAAQMSKAAKEVQYAVGRRQDKLEDAFSKTTGGVVQGLVGSSLLVSGVGVNLALKRRGAKKQSAPIELKDSGSIDDQIFPDALYSDRLGLRHISRQDANDTSQILELRPSGRYRDRQDQIELKAMTGASALLAGFFIASSPAAIGVANTVDSTVTTLRETTPVASVSNYLAQKATDAAKPKLQEEVKKTTAQIIAKKLPKTERLAHTLPLMAAVKEKIIDDTSAQILNPPKANSKANVTSESHALANFAESFTAESPLQELTGILGLGGLAITRTIRRKSHLRSDAHSKIYVSEEFLRANLNEMPK